MQNYMEFICNELEELDRKAGKEGKLSMAEVQYGDMLAHTKKNLLKADEMYGESEYSMDGGSSRRGGSYAGGESGQSRHGGSYYRGGSRAGGSSYEGGGSSYARGRGRNARHDSMGRYSRAGDNEEYVEQLQEMMPELPPEAQQHIQKAIEKMEQM